jgi:hypothetical protein
MTEISDADLAADAEDPGIGHNSLAELSDLVSEHQDKSREIADFEDKIKELKAELRKIEENTLPDMMMQIGVEEITTTDGAVVSIKPLVTGSIPKKNEVEACKWLRENDHADIIIRKLSLSFSKGQDKAAQKVFDDLVKKGWAPISTETVNHMTLKSWAKECFEEGVELPIKLLGLYHGQKAQIKVPKSSK